MSRRIAGWALLGSCLLIAGCQKAEVSAPANTATLPAESAIAQVAVTPQEAAAPAKDAAQTEVVAPAEQPASEKTEAPQAQAEAPQAQVAVPSQTYVIAPGPNVQFELQARLIEAVPGDVVQLEEGRYELHRQLDVAANNVTIRGRGSDKTVLTYKGQELSGQGLEVTGNNFVIEDLAIEDTANNAVKVVGAKNVTFRGVRTEWTGEPSSSNGAYGLYPVQCENVLMENCVAIGASDAGIYVGQCRNVVVRNNRAERNVAGIEIENTVNADVYENLAINNSGGLMVFDMAGLQLKAGRDVRCYQNKVIGNNHPNFADPGATVANVAPGTGVMVMASDSVEIFNNEIDNNQTVSVLVVSYLAIETKLPADFDPFPEQISIHNNKITNGGQKPSGKLGELLKPLIGETFPDILWDGMVNPVAGKPSLSIVDNGSATFVNFNLGLMTPENLVAGKYKKETDIAPFAVAMTPLPAITLMPHEPPAAGGSRAAQVYRSAPKKLSEWALFQDAPAQQQPAEGVFPYDLNTPLFSDYAHKRRFIRVPPGQQVQYRENESLDFPVGTVMAKTFSYPHDLRDLSQGEKLVETRVQFREADGWYGLTYVWNDEQTDALLTVGGSQAEVSWIHTDGQTRSTTYEIPNANQCLTCHGQNKSYQPIGTTARNLNRMDMQGGTNQLEYAVQVGVLVGMPELSTVEKMPRFDDPQTGSVETRARAWLDVNCAHCHNPAGTARTTGLDLRADQADPAKIGVYKNPVAAGHGSGGRKYDVVPGKPDESIVVYRLESPDTTVMMPNVGRRLIQPEAVALVREWIEGLKDPKAE